MKKYFIIILTIFLTSSCFKSSKSEIEFSELYRQRLPNTSKVIYHYSYWGKFVTSSNFNGYTILDSTKNLTVDKINKIDGDSFSYKDSNNQKRTIVFFNEENYKTDKDTLVIINHKNITTHLKDDSPLKFDSGLGMTSSYFFKGFIDKADSITFYGVKEDFGKKLPDRISYKKIGIFVDQMNNIIQKFTFSQTKIFRIDNEIKLGTETLEFRPTDSLKISTVSDYGFFKRIK